MKIAVKTDPDVSRILQDISCGARWVYEAYNTSCGWLILGYYWANIGITYNIRLTYSVCFTLSQYLPTRSMVTYHYLSIAKVGITIYIYIYRGLLKMIFYFFKDNST